MTDKVEFIPAIGRRGWLGARILHAWRRWRVGGAVTVISMPLAAIRGRFSKA